MKATTLQTSLQGIALSSQKKISAFCPSRVLDDYVGYDILFQVMEDEGKEKDVVWFGGGVSTPPFSVEARREAGFLLRQLQRGEMLSLPQSRPMPSIGKRCHELRIQDRNKTWRIVYRIDADAIVVLEVFEKRTQQTPKSVIDTCKKRIKDYDS